MELSAVYLIMGSVEVLCLPPPAHSERLRHPPVPFSLYVSCIEWVFVGEGGREGGSEVL